MGLTYLEGALPQGDFEIVGLTDEDDLVDVEFIRPANDFAVGMLPRGVNPKEYQLELRHIR